MKFACPHCNQRIEATDEFAGLQVGCPVCSGTLAVPLLSHKYWAFLSYSHQDNISVRADGRSSCIKWAEWLHREIEAYQVPAEFRNRNTCTGEPMPKRFFPVFQDEKELPLSGDLGESIRQALQQSRFLIIICSPRSAVSRYVNEEVRYFKQLGRGNRILALIVDGEPNASRGNKLGILPEFECFCPAMRHPLGNDGLEDINCHDPQEPIAGDTRIKSAEPLREAVQSDLRRGHRLIMDQMKLKLLAGLMGVGLDELVRRDSQRALAEARAKRRRIVFVSSCFAVLAVVALLATTTAVRQKIQVYLSLKEAEAQRKISGEKTQEAEAQRKVSGEKTKEAETQRLLALFQRYSTEFAQVQFAWEEGSMDRIRTGLDATRPTIGDPDLRGWEWHYLNSIFQRPSRTFSIGDGRVFPGSVSWNRSGRFLATGGGPSYAHVSRGTDWPVQIWETETGNLKHTLAESGSVPTWNAQGDRLAAIANNKIKIWEIPSGKLLREYSGHGTTLSGVAWRPGHNQIAFGGNKLIEGTKEFVGELAIKDVSTDRAIFDLTWNNKGVRDIDWSPNGAVLSIGWIYPVDAKDKPGVSFYDPESGKVTRLQNRASGQNGTRSISWSNDGKTIAMDTGGVQDNPIELFDSITAKKHKELDNGNLEFGWSPNSEHLLGVAQKGNRSLLKLWTPSSKLLSTLLWLPSQPVRLHFSWSADGSMLATLSCEPGAKEWKFNFWDINELWCDHQTIFVHPSKISASSVGWSHDGKFLASGSIEGDIVICDAKSSVSIRCQQVHKGAVLGLAWSPVAHEVLSTGGDGKIGIISASGGDAFYLPSGAGSNEATTATWSRDGNQVAIGTKSGRILICDRKTGVMKMEWPAHESPINSLVWLPSGDVIASADEAGQLKLSSYADKAVRASAETGHGHLRALTCDSVGESLATCGDDHRVRIWNAATLEPGPILENHVSNVISVSFNHSDRRLASVDHSGVVWIWDATHANGLLRIQDTVFSPTREHRAGWFTAKDLSWSPDGMRLAVAGEDISWRGSEGIIHIWNAAKLSDVPSK